MKRMLAGLLGLSLVFFVGCGEVTNPGNGNGADAFVPLPDPTIETVTPDRGPLAGGTAVTIIGTGFSDNAGTTSVIVGAFVATNVTVNSDAELTFETPAGVASETVAITVFNEAGFIMSDASFTYNDLPAVTGIDIDTGTADGGLEVTVTGTGFSANAAGTNTIDIGGTAGTNVTVNSDTELTFDTGVHNGAAFEFLDLTLTNANGSAVLGEAFRYLKSGLLAAGNARSGGFSQEGVDLYYIDPATGDTISLGLVGGGALTRGITGMAPVGDGRFYAATTRLVNQCCDRELVTIDPLNLDVVTPIGMLRHVPSGDNRGVSDLSYVNGTLYGASATQSRLVSINVGTGEYSNIGGTAINFFGIVFTPDGTGNLYWMRTTDGPLDRMNVSTGTLTNLTTLQGPGGSRIGGAAQFGGTLYAVTFDNPSELMAINPTNGFVQVIGEVPRDMDSMIRTPW